MLRRLAATFAAAATATIGLAVIPATAHADDPWLPVDPAEQACLDRHPTAVPATATTPGDDLVCLAYPDLVNYGGDTAYNTGDHPRPFNFFGHIAGVVASAGNDTYLLPVEDYGPTQVWKLAFMDPAPTARFTFFPTGAPDPGYDTVSYADFDSTGTPLVAQYHRAAPFQDTSDDGTYPMLGDLVEAYTFTSGDDVIGLNTQQECDGLTGSAGLTFNMGEGADTVSCMVATINAGGGDDTITLPDEQTPAGAVTVDAGAGADTVYGGSSADSIVLGSGDDTAHVDDAATGAAPATARLMTTPAASSPVRSVADAVAGGAGVDTVYADSADRLGADIEHKIVSPCTVAKTTRVHVKTRKRVPLFKTVQVRRHVWNKAHTHKIWKTVNVHKRVWRWHKVRRQVWNRTHTRKVWKTVWVHRKAWTWRTVWSWKTTSTSINVCH